MAIKIRPAIADDVPVLADLFYKTVVVHGPQHYSAAQTQAWAASTQDTEQFQRFILGVKTYVAESANEIVGFGGLAADGHVASLYVRHDCLGQGIGSGILAYLIEQAKCDRSSRLYAEASVFSLGLFKKFGFQQYDTEVVERAGATFTRYLVEKHDES